MGQNRASVILQEADHPLDKALSLKLKPIVFNIFHVLPLERLKNEIIS